MPGMASCHATDCKIAAFNYSKDGDRFLGISGAAGEKPAIIADQWAEANFVTGNQKN
jgi:hypothetical protein